MWLTWPAGVEDRGRLKHEVGVAHLFAPFGDQHSVLKDFKLTSWRYLAHPPQRFVPRALRKLQIARGFMVYEGLS